MLVEGVRRIAVLRANAIGDFLMVVPALDALRRAYPAAEITVIGDEWLPEFLRDRPGPWSHAVVAPSYPGLRGLPTDAHPSAEVDRFLADHRGRYDLVLQMHGGGATSNRLVALLEPRVSAGTRTPEADPLDRCIPYVGDRHEVLRWLEVAELVDATGPERASGLLPRIAVTEPDLAESLSAWPSDVPFAAFHVGARDERRRWSAEGFATVAQRLWERHSLRTVLVGGPGDEDPSRDVAERLDGQAVDLTGRLSLRGTLGAAARSTLFVGNDSGPRHLAAAAGTPTVGVFWIGNMLTFGPLVGAGDRAAVSFRVSCPVCGQTQLDERCDHDVSFVDEVTTDEVTRAADELLAQPSLRPASGSCR